MKKRWLLLFTLLVFPFSVIAYSNKIIAGGETIGIQVQSKGVYIVGFYPINGEETAAKTGLKKGDRIIKIDNQEISNIRDLNRILTKEKIYQLEVERKNKTLTIPLPVMEEEYILKTGLYVKDQVNGIGTLSYIDPETKIYGSLGHEILESSSQEKFQIQNGKVYKAEVTSIVKSRNGEAGSKNAIIEKGEEIGNVSINEIEGIFGRYTNDLQDGLLVDVGTKEEIHRGKAILKTVIEDEQVEEFTINVLAIDESSDNKNILFEITDQKLLNKTGGIVQGMSGSPIIQDNKIIGVVNYVIIEDTKKGYGIFITTMLEKGDELLS